MSKFFSQTGDFLKFFIGFLMWFFAVAYFEKLVYAGLVALFGTTVAGWILLVLVVYAVYNGFYTKSLKISLGAVESVCQYAKSVYARFRAEPSNRFSGYDFT